MSWWRRLRRLIAGDDSLPADGRVSVLPFEDRAPGSVSRRASDTEGTIRGPTRSPDRPEEQVIRSTAPTVFDDPEATLSTQEVRRRFMKLRRGGIFPHAPPEEIPSRADEFTRLVDRSLVLAGLLTEIELDEIHRVGDEWLKYKDAERFAMLQSAKTADEAVEAFHRARQERKIQRRADAEQRAQRERARVAEWRRTQVAFLGEGVSGGLADHKSHLEKLAARRLPVLSTPAELAAVLEIDVPTLRWLAFHQEAARVSHYIHFEIAKRSGGQRIISAPKPKLARVQRWILSHVVERLPPEPEAHGFVEGRSVVTNARPHVGRRVVFNLDLDGFFPSITFPRIRGLFQSIGYSPSVSTVLALLCTECPRAKMTYAGVEYEVAVSDRALPQGACTSPGLSNAIAARLDRRLRGLSTKAGWTYTRYADDLTFSSDAPETLAGFWASVRHVIEDEGFRLNRKKGRVQRAGRRQSVTGITVNQRLSLPRTEVRRLRAIVHNAEKTGLAAQNRDGDPKFEARLMGKIAYLSMVDPDKGRPLLVRLQRLDAG